MSTLASLLAEFDHLLQQEVEAYEHLLALHQEAQHCLVAPALDPLLANLQAREHLARHILAPPTYRQSGKLTASRQGRLLSGRV